MNEYNVEKSKKKKLKLSQHYWITYIQVPLLMNYSPLYAVNILAPHREINQKRPAAFYGMFRDATTCIIEIEFVNEEK